MATPVQERNQGLYWWLWCVCGWLVAAVVPTSCWDCGAVTEATCYVGNLDEKITESLLWELFLQAGPVGSISV